MDRYVVEGNMKMGRDQQNFTKTVEASSNSHAKEIAQNQIASEHSAKKTIIKVNSVEAKDE